MKIFIFFVLIILLYTTLLCSNTVDVLTEQPKIQKGINTTDDIPQIFDKIHSLYSDMMTFFGILVAFLVAFVGVLIPMLTNFYQNRKLKIEKINLKQELLKEIKSEIKSHFDSYEDQFEKKIEKMEIRFEKTSEAVNGMVFHSQGRYEFHRKNYVTSLQSYITASSSYLKGEDYVNLQKINSLIVKNCLPKVSNEDFENSLDLEEEIKKLIKLHEKYNDEARYTVIIRTMKKELKKAKKRKSPLENK